MDLGSTGGIRPLVPLRAWLVGQAPLPPAVLPYQAARSVRRVVRPDNGPEVMATSGWARSNSHFGGCPRERRPGRRRGRATAASTTGQAPGPMARRQSRKLAAAPAPRPWLMYFTGTRAAAFPGADAAAVRV